MDRGFMNATTTTAKVPPLVTRDALPRSKTDFMTEAGAGQLATTIKAAWAKVGHDDVEAWVTKVKDRPRGEPVYTVNTNLIRGLPPALVSRRQLNNAI
jgi:hypothetical protein